MGIVAEIDALNPQLDRIFGAELCEHFGIDPNEVARLVIWAPPERPGCLMFEFYKFKFEPGWWGFDSNMIKRGPDGPEFEVVAIEYLQRG